MNFPQFYIENESFSLHKKVRIYLSSWVYIHTYVGKVSGKIYKIPPISGEENKADVLVDSHQHRDGSLGSGHSVDSQFITTKSI